MQLLKVVARANYLCTTPNSSLITGSPADYIGREHDPSTGSYPIANRVDSFDFKTPAGRRIRKLLRQGCLLAADKATADLAGVAYLPLTFSDGEWQPST